MKYIIPKTYEHITYINMCKDDGYYEDLQMILNQEDIPEGIKNDNIVTLDNSITNVTFKKTMEEAVTHLKLSHYLYTKDQLDTKTLEHILG